MLTRRQLFKSMVLCTGCGGYLAACSRSEPTDGLAGVPAVSPIGMAILPNTSGTPGIMSSPTSRSAAIGTVVLPTAAARPNPFSDIQTPIILPSSPPYSTPLPSDPIRGEISFARDQDPRGAIRSAALIVIATVVEMRPARWSTPDGQRPANPWDKQNGQVIYTPTFMQIEQTLKGTASATRLPIAVLGGEVGRDYARYTDGLYDFTVGERVVVFLEPGDLYRPISIDGLTTWMTTYRYTITDDQRATNSYITLPLQDLLGIIAASAIPGATPPLP